MSLPSLPAVLVQTLMHSLRAKEILSLARCSKWTLECADSAFAWRDCPPLELRWAVDADSVVLPTPSRLSRWIPLAISPVTEYEMLSEVDAARLLELMHTWPRISRLGWWQWDLTVERGLELLSHPCMQQLTDIGLYIGMHAEWLAAALSLPCLTELDVMRVSLADSSVLQPLVHAVALRKLWVSETHGECLSVLMQLAQLSMLSIRAPRIDGGNFLAFCAAMSGLGELQLLSWDRGLVRSISSADLAAGLASLRSLRTLRFLYRFDEETLAPVLHFAPSLRVLSLPAFPSGHVPTLLAQLSLVNPMLEIELDGDNDPEALQRTKQALTSVAPVACR